MLVLANLLLYKIIYKFHKWKHTNTQVPQPVFSVEDFDQLAISFGGLGFSAGALAGVRTGALSLHRCLLIPCSHIDDSGHDCWQIHFS